MIQGLPHKRYMETKFSQNDVLTRGVIEIIDADHLKKQLASGVKLRIKLGIDPTGPDLHLGHSVVLWKLRQFQDLGHTAILIIGDYTALIGDPSGRDKTRPTLSEGQIKEYYKSYEKQALKILNKKNLEIHKQSEWYKKFSLKDFIEITAQSSVGYLLSHETFANRLKNKQPFSAHELFYPFLQGYDSVAVKADVELGALEQKFNLLMGREIQEHFGMKPQDIVMVPYLIGTDGKEKMGKTLNNYISLGEPPEEMFGRLMSIHDEYIVEYFELLTPLVSSELEHIKKSFKGGGTDARDLKLKLAETITSIYWGDKKAGSAAHNFRSVFQEDKNPDDMAEFIVDEEKILLVDLLIKTELALSKGEARRAIRAGAVRIDGQKKDDDHEIIVLTGSIVLSMGKRKIIRVKKRPLSPGA